MCSLSLLINLLDYLGNLSSIGCRLMPLGRILLNSFFLHLAELLSQVLNFLLLMTQLISLIQWLASVLVLFKTRYTFLFQLSFEFLSFLDLLFRPFLHLSRHHERRQSLRTGNHLVIRRQLGVFQLDIVDIGLFLNQLSTRLPYLVHIVVVIEAVAEVLKRVFSWVDL